MIFKKKRLAYFEEFDKDLPSLPDVYKFRAGADPEEVHKALARLYGQEIKIPATFMSEKMSTCRLLDPAVIPPEKIKTLRNNTTSKPFENINEVALLSNEKAPFPSALNHHCLKVTPTKDSIEVCIDVPNKIISWYTFKEAYFKSNRLAYFEEFEGKQPDVYTFTPSSSKDEVAAVMSRLEGQEIRLNKNGEKYRLKVLDTSNLDGYFMIDSDVSAKSKLENIKAKGTLRFLVVNEQAFRHDKRMVQCLQLDLSESGWITTIDIPNKTIDISPVTSSSFRANRLAYFEEFDELPNEYTFTSTSPLEEIHSAIARLYDTEVKVSPRFNEPPTEPFTLLSPEKVRESSQMFGQFYEIELNAPDMLFLSQVGKERTYGETTNRFHIEAAPWAHAVLVINVPNKTIAWYRKSLEKKAYFEDALEGVNLRRNDFIELNDDPSQQSDPKPKITENNKYCTQNWAVINDGGFGMPARLVPDRSITHFTDRPTRKMFWSPALDLMFTESDVVRKIPGYDREKMLDFLYTNWNHLDEGMNVSDIFKDPKMEKRAYFEEIENDETINDVVGGRGYLKDWVKNPYYKNEWMPHLRDYANGRVSLIATIKYDSTTLFVRHAIDLHPRRYLNGEQEKYDYYYNKPFDLMFMVHKNQIPSQSDIDKILIFLSKQLSATIDFGQSPSTMVGENYSMDKILHPDRDFKPKLAYFEEIDEDPAVQKAIRSNGVKDFVGNGETNYWDEIIKMLAPHFDEDGWRWNSGAISGFAGILKRRDNFISIGDGRMKITPIDMSSACFSHGMTLRIDIPNKCFIWGPSKTMTKKAYFEEFEDSVPKNEVYKFNGKASPSELIPAVEKLYGKHITYFCGRLRMSLYVLDPDSIDDTYTMYGGEPAVEYKNSPSLYPARLFILADEFSGRKDRLQVIELRNGDGTVIDLTNRILYRGPLNEYVQASVFSRVRLAYFDEFENDKDIQKQITHNKSYEFPGGGGKNYWEEYVSILDPYMGQEWTWKTLVKQGEDNYSQTTELHGTLFKGQGDWNILLKTTNGARILLSNTTFLQEGSLLVIDIPNKTFYWYIRGK